MIKIIDGLNGYQFIDVSMENIDESISYICADSSMRSLYLSSKNQNEGLIERICVHPDRTKIRHLHIMCEIENVRLFESFDWLEEINFGVENTRFNFSKMKNLKMLGGIWSKFWKGLEHCLLLESFHVSRFSNLVASIPNLAKLKRIVLIQPNLSSLNGIESAKRLVDLELTMAKKLENIDALNSCAPTLLKLKLDGCRKIRSYDAIEKLVNLSYLILSGSADLVSISFIEKMPKLVTLSIYETKLLDNNLTYCISHPSLIDFRSENKRTYIPTVQEVEAKLISKTKNSEFNNI
ncbi:hypothetical protein RF679_00770 [Undibacterium cyanobacteriorum]|uniref:Internalin n=1 Tax=Undibacterium cyanobacteriorum TaxID=3073561 RepID=A0ABY9RHY1_9BURK|nr:hypothetical protein [Undibacterium sp. 20NA77.5]WMW80828.1 hypothetical protein RF679_00770 [Undibacterium sp. 20NA77.5]